MHAYIHTYIHTYIYMNYCLLEASTGDCTCGVKRKLTSSQFARSSSIPMPTEPAFSITVYEVDSTVATDPVQRDV